MEPKRARASGSYNATRFVSVVASEWYTQSLIKKVPILVHGFDIREGDFPNFDRIIQGRNWI